MTDFADLAAGLLSLAALVGYHLWLERRARHAPTYAVHTTNAQARQRWIERVMRDPAREMLAVQTLRNSVMAASFMASTAILLMMGVLSVAGDAERLQKIQRALPWDNTPPAIETLKLMCAGVDLFGAFFLFAMSIRFFTHAGYLIAAPQTEPPGKDDIAAATAHLNRAGRFFSLGLRTFFYCFPLVFWLFGPLPLLLACAALIAALYLLDRMPVGE